MLIAGFCFVYMLAVALVKKNQTCRKWFQRGKKPQWFTKLQILSPCLSKYSDWPTKSLLESIFCLYFVGCHSAIVQVEVKESRLDILFAMLAEVSDLLLNVYLRIYVYYCLMVINLWKWQPPPPLFSCHKTVVENTEIMLCITAVLTVHVEVSVMEIAGGIFQLIKEHRSLILQPHIEPRLYFRNIFPYFPHGQFW